MERERVFLIGVVAIIMNGMRLTALADAPDTLFFEAESDKVLSTDSSHPTTLFAGTLDDYEPAYAYFDSKSSSGSRFFVNREISLEILRPYNIIRTSGEMTVQFQGVTRTHANPHTASITVKFTQSGENIVAYTIRAAALKPLDIELGLDLDAMVDAQNPRVEARPLTGEVRDAGYNICAVAMRKPAAAIERVVHEGDSISDTFAGNGAVSVTHAAADTTSYDGYLPNNSWVVVAANHDLADLDVVEGSYHYGVNSALRQTAYNLKYTIKSDRFGQKTCQFQMGTANGVTGALVQFRQNGSNVEALTSQYRMYYANLVDAPGCEDQVVVGMDFERFGTATGSVPLLRVRNTYGASDDVPQHGVKDLVLKFRSRPTVLVDGYMPNGNDTGVNFYTNVAGSHLLSDLVEIEAFYHTGANKGYRVPGVNLNISGNSGTVQFQNEEAARILCIGCDLKQSGDNIEMRTGRNCNWHMKFVQDGVSYSNEVFYGTDFYSYTAATKPARGTFGSIGTADSSASFGIKDLRLRFATGGIAYSATSTSVAGHDLTFLGSAGSPLVVRTASSTVFPSNGVVTVSPYSELTVAEHVTNGRWTQYRVLTNGTLRLKGSTSTARTDQIDLVGGVLSIREDETNAAASDSYVNYLTLMNGACVRGKLARVLHDTVYANWIVAGDSPSTCESGLLITAAGGDTERTFSVNVNDVTGNAQSDFLVSGDIIDYGTQNNSDSYWNVHVIKAGAGTMELSGDVTLPNEICVSNGAVRIAGDCTFGVSRKRTTDGSNATAEIWLAGGALETAAVATNTIGKVVAKVKDAQLNLGNGSKLTLAGFDFDNGANLLVSDNLGKCATLRIEGLTDAQRVRIRCGADRLRVREDANGNLEPYTAGFMLSVK